MLLFLNEGAAARRAAAAAAAAAANGAVAAVLPPPPMLQLLLSEARPGIVPASRKKETKTIYYVCSGMRAKYVQ